MNKLKILAVDDEEYVLNAIKPLCLDHDLETETLPFKAIERIKKEKFDIFVVDYQMPQLNGIELLEEIKEVYADRKYVSIFCTAYGTMYLFKEEQCGGLFDFFVEKPFESETLKNTLQKAIDRLDP